MNKVVHKMTFMPGQVLGTFILPADAKFVGFSIQRGADAPSFWYERDAFSTETAQWRLRVVGTGEYYEDDLDYLAGPALIGSYVFHLVGKRL